MRIGDDTTEASSSDFYGVRFSNSKVTDSLAELFDVSADAFRVKSENLSSFVKSATAVCHKLTSKSLQSPAARGPLGEQTAQVGDEAARIIEALPPELQAVAASDPTIREALVKQRRGQDKYRDAMEKLWNGRCPVTGVVHADFLVASHAKPWANSNPQERLDPYNGILLAVQIDRAFDRGLITFDNNGILVVSPKIPRELACKLLDGVEKQITFKERHLPYISYHRENIFKK